MWVIVIHQLKTKALVCSIDFAIGSSLRESLS